MNVKTIRSGRARATQAIRLTVIYLVLTLGAIACLVPFLWMLSSSLKKPSQVFVFPPIWIPKPITFEAYRNIFTTRPMELWLGNSALVAVIRVVGNMISNSLAAYAFARLDFKGRDKLFFLYLGTMMIPGQVTLIPNYALMRAFGWIDTRYALIVPGMFGSPFGTFMLRQFFMTIPKDLEDAAFIDGASHFTIYARIIMPLSGPALATLAVFIFMGSWNAFLWPLIMINSVAKKTIPLGLAELRGVWGPDWPGSMAGSVMSVIPVLVVFLAAQPYFVQGITLSGIKA